MFILAAVLELKLPDFASYYGLNLPRDIEIGSVDSYFYESFLIYCLNIVDVGFCCLRTEKPFLSCDGVFSA
jgi:hypothetical protein